MAEKWARTICKQYFVVSRPFWLLLMLVFLCLFKNIFPPPQVRFPNPLAFRSSQSQAGTLSNLHKLHDFEDFLNCYLVNEEYGLVELVSRSHKWKQHHLPRIVLFSRAGLATASIWDTTWTRKYKSTRPTTAQCANVQTWSLFQLSYQMNVYL